MFGECFTTWRNKIMIRMLSFSALDKIPFSRKKKINLERSNCKEFFDTALLCNTQNHWSMTIDVNHQNELSFLLHAELLLLEFVITGSLFCSKLTTVIGPSHIDWTGKVCLSLEHTPENRQCQHQTSEDTWWTTETY